MNKSLISYNSSLNPEVFLDQFSVIPSMLPHNKKRPLPKSDYWKYLISVFPEVEKELYIFREGDRDLGRISVNLSVGNKDTAFFGMIDHCIENKVVSKELYAAAEMWAKKQGAKSLIGPIDLNVWFGNRFQTDGFNTQFSWAPNNPSEYYKIAIDNGFKKDQGYSSKFFDALEEQVCRTKNGHDLALREGYTFRPMNLDSDADIERLYKLNTDSFSANYLYEPISKEQYFKTHIEFIKGTDLSLSFFIIDKEMVPRGYVYCFLDEDILIIKSILIEKEFQGAKLSSALIHKACKEAHNRGYTKGAGVLIRDGNVSSKFYDKIGDPFLVHKYNMVKKELY